MIWLDINKRIKKLVSYYQRVYGTNDPKRIAEFLGIHIVYVPLGNALGYYRYMKRIKWIFINEDILEDENLVRVVMAHELGHAVLHWKENCCFMAHHTLMLTSRIEQQANAFAAQLLITDEMLNEYSGCTIEQFCSCTGIPEEFVRLKSFETH